MGPLKLAGTLPASRASLENRQSDWPSIAYAADGALYVAYVEWNDADIFARRYGAGKWGPEVRISTSDAGDWDPAVALSAEGLAWISWDSYHYGNYDVFLRSFDGARAGPVVSVTTESTAQFHSSVAVDKQGRVWVAWDDGGENWGKDFSRSSAMPGSQGLHYSRSIGLRIYANGRMVGEEFEAPLGRAPRIEATVEAPDTILRMDVVKDGKFVYTRRPGGRTARLSYLDTETRPGRSYYYIRVFQRDPEDPEGDPEIAWASPFYVTYK